MNAARAYRQKGKRRKASGLTSHTETLAFRFDSDARHAIDGNPNRAKFHASRANLNVSDPASAARERVSRNQGRRARGESSRVPYLETSNARIPALGSTLSKRVPRA